MHRTIILMSCSRKQDAAHCSHAVTHSLQAPIQLSYCLDGITFLLSCFVCFWISERRVHKISPLNLRRGRLRNVPLSWMMGGAAPPTTDPAESCLSSHGRKSCLRVGRRDANQLCVHKLRTENSVSFAIGSNGFARHLLITERSRSVQNSSA